MNIVHYSARLMDTITFCGLNAARTKRDKGEPTYHHKYTSEGMLAARLEELCSECADRAPLIALAAASL